MKRRRRGGSAAPAAGACDVWLDTAELKRSPVQPLLVKPKVSSRVLDWRLLSVPFTQPAAPQARSKQTTISSFFCTQTDEQDKENSRPPPSIVAEDCEVKGTSSAASPAKVLPLPQVEEAQKPSRRAEGVQAPPRRRAPTAAASAAPVSGAECHSVSKASCAVGEAAATPFSVAQDSEGNQVMAHRHDSGLFTAELAAGGGSRTSGCRIDRGGEELSTRLDWQPGLGASQSQEHHQLRSIHSLIDLAEAENINPAVRRGRSCAAELYSSPGAGRAELLRERSSNAEEGQGSKAAPSSPCRDLFTQDSEGNRVISHRCWSVPAPPGAPRSSLPSSSCKGRSSDAAKRSLSKLGEDWADLCHDLLFTQDSQGNRVIKH
ncbi:membrane progestin receptor alpha isoform X1 [Pogoniulus pusillus]|uniref:membrane progestin receptor alpha isoform X1 n=1 Tax=Pogoniulus pusillus TaxID=488313 RepID=UPI0030B94346